MDGVVDFLKRNRDLLWKIAVAASALAIVYPVLSAYYLWIGGAGIITDHPKISFWVLGNYFFDPLIAALLLGALVRNWRIAYLAAAGLALQLILVTGTIIGDDTVYDGRGGTVGIGGESLTQLGVSKFQAYVQIYLTTTLSWIWILGLIAFGVALGRKVGDFFSELDEAPDSPPA